MLGEQLLVVVINEISTSIRFVSDSWELSLRFILINITEILMVNYQLSYFILLFMLFLSHF